MSKLTFEASADTKLIYARLKKAAVDETVSYEEIEAAVSRPLAEIRGSIDTARRWLLRQDGRVFGCERNVGLRRCTDEAIVDSATADTQAIRRRARRGVERLSKVADYSSLSPARQLEHTTRMSVLGAVAMFTRETSVDQVRSACQGRATELPIAETLRAFLPAGG